LSKGTLPVGPVEIVNLYDSMTWFIMTRGLASAECQQNCSLGQKATVSLE
jgi:hypothetical protein